MTDTIIAITYMVIFIPGIFLFYFLMQGFQYEKLIKAGKVAYFKAFYILICIILSGLLAFVIVNTMAYLSQLVTK